MRAAAVAEPAYLGLDSGIQSLNLVQVSQLLLELALFVESLLEPCSNRAVTCYGRMLTFCSGVRALPLALSASALLRRVYLSVRLDGASCCCAGWLTRRLVMFRRFL